MLKLDFTILVGQVKGLAPAQEAVPPIRPWHPQTSQSERYQQTVKYI